MTTTTTTRRIGWARRALLGVLALTAALTTAAAAAPAPAQAATYGSITACFRSGAVTSYGTVWGPAQYSTVYVDVWNGSSWVPRATTRTATNGCVTHSVQTGYYWHLRLDSYTVSYRVVGTSNYALVSQPVNYFLGTTNCGTFRR